MTEKANPAAIGPVGVVGLGNMGGSMAVNMCKAGFEVVGTDLLADFRDKLVKAGGTAVNSAAEVGQKCRYIILSLPSEAALNAVAAELAESCAKGTIVMETGTLPLAAKERNRDLLAEKGVILLDTPLSGTGAQAANKDLVILGSGDEKAFKEFSPIFDGFARSYYYLGEFGNGMKMKFIANQLVAIHNVAAAEAILLGKRMGMDPAMVVEVIGDGAGSSRMFQVRGPLMVKEKWDDSTATNIIFGKDLRLISEAILKAGSPSPLFFATIPIYTATMSSGHENHDTAAVFDVLQRMADKPADK